MLYRDFKNTRRFESLSIYGSGIVPFYFQNRWLCIKNPSKKAMEMILRHDGSALCYLKNPSEEFQIIAVSQYGQAIKWIKHPSEKVQLAAIKENKNAFLYIRYPTKRVIESMKSIYPSILLQHRKNIET